MLTLLVVSIWLLVVLFSVLVLQSALCRRIWEAAAPPMPYRVFRAFARRRGRMREEGPSEDEAIRYGSHLLNLDHPAVVRANRWMVATTLLGVLASGLVVPLGRMLPD